MRYLIALTALLIVNACVPKVSDPSTRLHHVVLVWFDANTSAKEKEALLEASKTLAAIREVRALHIGRAYKSARSVVDSSFDIGLTFVFDDYAAMQRYLAHPSHRTFVERYIRGKVTKVKIYDY